MQKIKVLRNDVVDQIAAGEVVERPASVVKELVENAIDAGADNIEVEIEAAGSSLIRIADNGEGMTPDDAKLACQRHATSKISNIHDLERLNTLGFRGEALASISAVSQMDIITKTEEASSGLYMYLESGQVQKERPIGRSRGTTIEVRNLFYNVPARKKFLKKESTELAEIVNVVGRFILSYPGITIKLTQGSRCFLHATREMDLLERIRIVLGGEVHDGMVELSSRQDKFGLNGYVSKPSATRKTRRSQVFFVNGRFVKSRVLNDAVYESYRSMLERGRYPSAVLFFEVAPGEVDVNVHPTKLEVKFDDEKKVKSVLVNAIKNRIDSIKVEDKEKEAASRLAPEPSETPENTAIQGEDEIQDEFSYDFSGSPGALGRDSAHAGSLPVDNFLKSVSDEIYQIGGCYIVEPKNDHLVITDQHAAHERIMYEFFGKATEEKPLEKQKLLFPVTLELAAGQSVLMEKIVGKITALGFEVEPFGGTTYIIHAVPSAVKDSDVKSVVIDILEDLASVDLKRADLLDELIKITSCRAAIKAGDPLTRDEMISLLEQLSKCDLPFTCPHGRPVKLEITVDELEKRFRRK